MIYIHLLTASRWVFVSVFQFEYQQATLEAEVENLSWKVERAEITDRGVRALSTSECCHFI